VIDWSFESMFLFLLLLVVVVVAVVVVGFSFKMFGKNLCALIVVGTFRVRSRRSEKIICEAGFRQEPGEPNPLRKTLTSATCVLSWTPHLSAGFGGQFQVGETSLQ
jgi:hypothetical protein